MEEFTFYINIAPVQDFFCFIRYFSRLLTVDHLMCGLSMVMAGSKECIRIRIDHSNVILSRNRAISVCDRYAFRVVNRVVKYCTMILATDVS